MAATLDQRPSAMLSIVGNALGQTARPAVLLLCGVAYGPATVGDLAAALSVIVLATVVLYPALGQSVLRHAAGPRFTSGLVRRMGLLLLAGTAMLALAAAVDAITLRLLWQILPDTRWVFWVIALAPLTIAEQYALGLASVAGALDRYSLAMLASRVGLLLGALAVVLMRASPFWLLALFALSSCALLVQVARAVGRPASGPAPYRLRRDGWAAAPNAWAWFLIAQASVLVIQAFMGPTQTGLFTVAYLLLNLPALALQGVAVAWTANAAALGPAQEWARTRRLVPWLVMGHVAVIGAIAVVGTQFWSRFFDDALAPAFPLLARMALGAPGFALAYLFMPQWISRGWFLRLSAVYLGLALAYIAALAWAGRRGDLAAIGWCTAGLGLALASANLAAAWRWDRKPSAQVTT